MQLTAQQFTVADFDGTPLEDTFRTIPGDRLVVQVHDASSGMVCALAAAEGQPAADVEREARFQLAMYVAKQHRAAGKGDPRYEL